MTSQWICPNRLFDGTRIVAGQALRIEDGRIAEISDRPQDGLAIAGCLCPGFVDLQVNGGGGVLFNNAPTAVALQQITDAHRQFGTVAILPTILTDTPAVLEQAASAVLDAHKNSSVVGIHIEGPHISLERRGTHAAHHVRPLDDTTMAIVAHLRDRNVPVMITVAPESAQPAQIAALAATGAVVSLGHTNATADAIEEAIAAGASCGTHLFNAMSSLQSREPGAIGAILNAGIHFGLICDGLHVDYRTIRLALRAAAQAERGFLVSDAMATVGGPDSFDLYGSQVHLKDGRLINAEGGLAGAHVTQAEGVERLVTHVGVSLDQALRMAITIPAALMGLDHLSSLIGRDIPDLVVLSDDLTVTDLQTALPGSGGTLNAAE